MYPRESLALAHGSRLVRLLLWGRTEDRAVPVALETGDGGAGMAAQGAIDRAGVGAQVGKLAQDPADRGGIRGWLERFQFGRNRS
jgi:hypothetical protein